MYNKILTLLFISVTQLVFSQVAEVSLIIDPKSIDVGEEFTITVRSNVQGEVEIDNLPSSFVHGYNIVNGMEQEMDHNTGNVITIYSLSQTGAIGKTGKYTIGPAYIKKGNKTYKSNTVTIKVGDRTQMSSSDVTADQMKNPAFGIIQVNKVTVYEGEPILVSAKVYSHFNPTYLDGYLTYEMNGTIEKKPVGNSNRIVVDKEIFKGKSFFTFEYDKNIIFPTGTGKFKITPFVMNLHQGYNGFLLTSNHSIVDIKPLPSNPPKDFIGGVGVFRIERTVKESKFKQGEVFKMIITVSGSGNLQNTIEPSPNLPKGFIVYGDPQIEEKITFGSHGAEGSISYEYNIQVNTFGTQELPPCSISYFDLNQEKYVTVSTNSTPLEVAKDKNFVVNEVENETVNEMTELSESSIVRRSNVIDNSNTLYGSLFFWSGVGIPLAAALLFLFYVRKKEAYSDIRSNQLNIKRVDEELVLLVKQLETIQTDEENPAFYNLMEDALKKAFAVKMAYNDEKPLNKESVLTYIRMHDLSGILPSVQELFSICDQNRYGLASSKASKKQMLADLKLIIKQLKS